MSNWNNDILYQNNGGGMVPRHHDWDIRLLAVVPSAELDDWIPEGAEPNSDPPPGWLTELPGNIERAGITEWYRKARGQGGHR